MIDENELIKALQALQTPVGGNKHPSKMFVSPSLVQAARQILDAQTLSSSPEGLRKRHEIEVDFDD